MKDKKEVPNVGRRTIASIAGSALLIVAAGVFTSAKTGAGTTVQSSLQNPDTACSQLLRFLDPKSQADPAQKALARTCVNEVDMARRMSASALPVRDNLRLARTFSMIPEYHDEQRLRATAGSTSLGPMVGLYASPYLDDFKQEWQFWAHGAEGVFVAHIVVQRHSWEPVALPPTYQELGLVEGLNCLWLVKRNASAAWDARITPANGAMCDRNYVPAGAWTPPTLSVIRDAPYTSFADYPAVARISESRQLKPLLGVKCLSGWCEIGSGSFTRQASLAEQLSLPATAVRARVKGWYDDQDLSVVHPTTGLWVGSGLHAALVPVNGIENLTLADFRPQMVHVSTLHLDAVPPAGSKYDSWGLNSGDNQIYLQWVGPDPIRDWRVEMRAPGRPPKRWNFVAREMHYDVGIPGTVRFRWSILDDGIWAPCGHSCCQVEG